MDFAYLLQHGGEPTNTIATALLQNDIRKEICFQMFCSCKDFKVICGRCKASITGRIYNVYQAEAYIGRQEVRHGIVGDTAELRKAVCLGIGKVEEMFWSYSYSEISLAIRILSLKRDITPIKLLPRVLAKASRLKTPI